MERSLPTPGRSADDSVVGLDDHELLAETAQLDQELNRAVRGHQQHHLSFVAHPVQQTDQEVEARGVYEGDLGEVDDEVRDLEGGTDLLYLLDGVNVDVPDHLHQIRLLEPCDVQLHGEYPPLSPADTGRPE